MMRQLSPSMPPAWQFRAVRGRYGGGDGGGGGGGGGGQAGGRSNQTRPTQDTCPAIRALPKCVFHWTCWWAWVIGWAGVCWEKRPSMECDGGGAYGCSFVTAVCLYSQNDRVTLNAVDQGAHDGVVRMGCGCNMGGGASLPPPQKLGPGLGCGLGRKGQTRFSSVP